MKNDYFKYGMVLCLSLFLIISKNINAQVGNLGTGNIIGTNIDVNTRTYLTSDATLGSTSITVNNSSLSGSVFSGNLSSGDLILIIQMQGATINIANNASYGAVTNYNSAGLYEFRCVSSVPNSTTINFNVPLSNNYSSNGKTQVIRVPRYSTFNLASGNSIRPATWDGNRGGITVIEIGGNGTINGTIDASGRGFRGGANDNSSGGAYMGFYSSNVADGGRKGESIAGGDVDYDALGGRYGRGAPANGGGGGNSHNAGGGGGANGGVVSAWNGLGNPDNGPTRWTNAWNLEGGLFSTNTSSGGGRGGYSYSHANRDAIIIPSGNNTWTGNNRINIGGYGGRPLAFSNTRIFFGGGGGAGDGNNSAATGGGNGGGMVLILCYGNLSGSGIITSSGGNSPNTMAGHNDAPGGGGGGGTILLSVDGTIANTLNLFANGGSGGNQLITNLEAEGPGGGGGGGTISISNGNPTRVANGGVNGTTTSASLTEFTANGATKGGAGTTNGIFSVTSIIDQPISSATGSDTYCGLYELHAQSTNGHSKGTWFIVNGSGGSFSDIHNPNATFTGDSLTTFTLVWQIDNNICQTIRDTFFLSFYCIPLGVNLLNFEGIKKGYQHHLKWTSSMEENMKAFVILRSTDGENFEEIAQIQPNNNQGLNHYEYTDVFYQQQDYVYYQLKMVDNDNSYRKSEVIELNFNQVHSDIKSIQPNPAQGELTIETKFSASQFYRFYITDIQGRIVKEVLDLQNQQKEFKLDINDLNSGLYVVSIIKKNGEKVSARFSKQ